MEQREGRRTGIECLARQMQHHRAVLADTVEHHRFVGLGDDLAHDVDALGFEAFEMGQHPFGFLRFCHIVHRCFDFGFRFVSCRRHRSPFEATDDAAAATGELLAAFRRCDPLHAFGQVME